ncbi:hypothetical protein FRX31_009260 [Thalictrum thalictroides]|uniref:Uncharacterized protein n=1 Tax=Thalictrum thalictroides TaxID=46969 RepID=A0A7J6WVR6_THATH|nr:hypothetical protein FRX31_009260 [Thalictrum thalictroides]
MVKSDLEREQEFLMSSVIGDEENDVCDEDFYGSSEDDERASLEKELMDKYGCGSLEKLYKRRMEEMVKESQEEQPSRETSMSMKRAYPELGFLTPPSSNSKVGRGVVGVEDDDDTPISKIEDCIEGKGIEIAIEKGIPNYVGSARTTIQLGEGLHAMCGIDDGMQDGVQTQGCHDHQATQPTLLKVSMDKEGGAATSKVSVTDKVQIDAISTSTIRTVDGTSKESGQQVAIIYRSLIEEMNNKGASRSEIEGNYGVHTTPKSKVGSWAKESEEGTQFVEHGKLNQFKVNSDMGLYG